LVDDVLTVVVFVLDILFANCYNCYSPIKHWCWMLNHSLCFITYHEMNLYMHICLVRVFSSQDSNTYCTCTNISI